uniref:Uncharacterized protein n=1 Tax=Anguilla anguilla TaxID=7936 RepID=A0A0E9URQ3_ANGAN
MRSGGGAESSSFGRGKVVRSSWPDAGLLGGSSGGSRSSC